MENHTKLFISVSKRDTDKETNKNCVKDFKKLLEIFFQRFHSQEVNISSSIDKEAGKLRDNSEYQIILLTSNYLNDNDAIAELDKILKNSKDPNTGSILKVLAEEISMQLQPEEIKSLPNYYFYYHDNFENTTFNFFELNLKHHLLFSNKIVNLGYDILTAHSQKNQSNTSTEDDQTKTVFLAFSGIDQINNRELIKRELQHKGFKVLPNYAIFDDKEKLKENILNDLSKSALSVHFLGEDNFALDNEDETLVEFQNQIAIDYYNKLNEFSLGQKDMLFSRIIWIPNDLQIKDENQRIWLENFIQSAELQTGAELIETPIETLKSIIEEKVSKKTQSSSKVLQAAVSSSNKVYIMYEYKDNLEIESLTNWLNDKKYTPLITQYDKDYLTIIEKHRQNLIQSDSIVILYLNHNPEWLESKLMDIKKSPGFGRSKSFKKKIILYKNKFDDVGMDLDDYIIEKINNNITEILDKILIKEEPK